jgi:hypothetical protein
MSYFVMKTGLPMFDACRAYGLALLLDRLAQEAGATEYVRVEDVGAFYTVHAPEVEEFASVSTSGLFDDLLVIINGWCGVFLTTGRATGEARLKPKSRKKLEAKIARVAQTIDDVSKLLAPFSEPSPIELRISKRGGFETLPASLDVSASKGIRRAKRDGYSEGEQLFVPQEQWAIGLLGGAHFIRWTRAGGNHVGLLPTPQSLTLRNHLDVRAIADVGFLCGVGVKTAAAHYAVRLAEALRECRVRQAAFDASYGTLVIQAMAFAGGQWKPQSGGLFPLEFPMHLAEGEPEISGEIFSLWDHLFRWGSVQGNENLALTLADFLAQPSLETFERHARTHLRMTLADERRRPFSPYQNQWMKEVLRYV